MGTVSWKRVGYSLSNMQQADIEPMYRTNKTFSKMRKENKK